MNNVSYYPYSLSVQSQGGDLAFSPRGGGGGEVNKFTERLRSEVQPVTLFAYYFSRKRSPFVYPLLINITLSHTLFRTLHPFLLL